MSTHKKIRGDAVLKTLPDERQDQLYRGLSKKTLAEGCKELAEDGLKVSQQSLSEFLSWYAMRLTFKEAETDTENLLELLKSELPDLPEAKAAQLGNTLFNLQAIKMQDPKLFLAMQTARHKAEMDIKKFEQRERELQQNERKIKLLEEKAATAKQALQAAATQARVTGGLSADTLRQIEEAVKIL